MDEENKVVTTPVTSPVVEESTSIDEEYVAGEETQAPSTSEVDAKEETSGTEQPDSAVSPWENEKKSMSGKISKLEKERNELAQQAKMLEALNVAAANDPEFMRIANRKLVEQGLLDESALSEIESTTPQPKTDGGNLNPAVLWAQQKMQAEREEREKFFKDFEDRHPDLTEGDPESIKANRVAVGATAAKKMREGVSQSEAYEFAYKLIMNPNQLVEDGKLQGLAQAQGASPVEGAASGAIANSSGTVELTPEQRETARRFGISEEKYAQQLGE